MESPKSPKRSTPPSEGEQPQPKRARTDTSEDVEMKVDTPSTEGRAPEQEARGSDQLDFSSFISTMPSLHDQARQGIQRSIALVLNHDGFDSATPEAMESFTQLVESCALHLRKGILLNEANLHAQT